MNPNSVGPGAGDAEAHKPSKTRHPFHNVPPPKAQAAIAGDPPESGTMCELVAIAIDQLASEPHDTIRGLRRRYYYRGAFILLEHLTARGLAVNVARLRRRSEDEHADRLAAAWKDANGGAAP
jgi:hypothetical protein